MALKKLSTHPAKSKGDRGRSDGEGEIKRARSINRKQQKSLNNSGALTHTHTKVEMLSVFSSAHFNEPSAVIFI